MQQTLAPETEPFNATPVPILRGWQAAIPLEWAAYALLLLVTVVFHLADLDTVPMSMREAPDALAAWRTVAPFVNAFPEEITTDSPVVFLAQKTSFSLLGSHEFAARILTALAGVALVFAPLLFRAELGRAATLVFVLLLLVSPVGLLAARSSQGVVWAALFAMIAVWALRRYWVTGQAGFATAGIVAVGLAALFSDPAGLLLMLILPVAALQARGVLTLETIDEATHPDPLAEVRSRLRQFPFLSSVAIAALVLVALSTLFMTYPAGLSGIGEVISSFGRGLTQRPPGAPRAYVLLVSVFYEPLLWMFALVGVILLIRRREFTVISGFLAILVAVTLPVLLLYPGSDAPFALLLTVPLAALAAITIAGLFTADRKAALWDDLTNEDDLSWLNNPRTGRLILAAAALVLITMLAMHLQIVGRAIVGQEDGSLGSLFAVVNSGGQNLLRGSLIWMVVTLLFLGIGGFLAASIWGNRVAVQGIALGLTGFMLINSLSAGWSGAVFSADSAAEPWYLEAVSDEVHLLRETLVELRDRLTMGYPELPITIVENPVIGLTRDSVAAWQARDFYEVNFVDTLTEARADLVIIAGDEGIDARPDLGGSYVGQDYAISRRWDLNSLRGFDFIAWWFQREVRQAPTDNQRVVLWIRLDVYENLPLQTTPNG